MRAHEERRGYFAPRLVGSGAGSLPPQRVGTESRRVARIPELRPRAFSLSDAGDERRFDPVAVGLTLPNPAAGMSGSCWSAAAAARATSTIPAGWGTGATAIHRRRALREEKRDLIEYLKTL